MQLVQLVIALLMSSLAEMMLAFSIFRTTTEFDQEAGVVRVASVTIERMFGRRCVWLSSGLLTP